MANKPALRFDHREIAVVFSLFVFVALLMFTVGILVGKGIAQAKFDALNGRHGAATTAHDSGDAAEGHAAEGHGESHAQAQGHGDGHGSGHGAPAAHGGGHAAATESGHGEKAEHKEEHAAEHKADTKAEHKELADAKTSAKEKEEEELELIPLGPQKTEWNGMSLRNRPPKEDAKKLLENPKIEALTEKDAVRTPTSTATSTALKKEKEKETLSFATGAYLVQVGSYPNQKDAEERVRTLKSLGFAHAHFSAKDLGDSNGTWFRVWLGHFPSYEQAKKSGDKLQARGEVKNYLVRKADAENGKN